MRRRADAARHHLDDAAPAPGARPRTGRGWGPFTGGQLAAIIIAVVVVVVSGSNGFVTNPATGKRAVVNTLGQVSAAVTGTVTANVTNPHWAMGAQINPGSTFTPLLSGPRFVGAIHLDFSTVAPGPIDAVQLGTSTDSCTSVAIIDNVHPAEVGEVQLTYGTGLYVPTGTTICARNSDAAHLTAAVSAESHT
jgi:hypothetical protein